MKKIIRLTVTRPIPSKKMFQVCAYYKDGTHSCCYFNNLEELAEILSSAIKNLEGGGLA